MRCARIAYSPTELAVNVIAHLLAGAALVPAQTPTPSRWSPERRLASAVLAAALAEVRDHHAKASYRRAIDRDLEWIFSDDMQWPFSFVPLCHALAVEPDYVRTMVRRWLSDAVMAQQVRHKQNEDSDNRRVRAARSCPLCASRCASDRKGDLLWPPKAPQTHRKPRSLT